MRVKVGHELYRSLEAQGRLKLSWRAAIPLMGAMSTALWLAVIGVAWWLL